MLEHLSRNRLQGGNACKYALPYKRIVTRTYKMPQYNKINILEE